MSVAEQPIEYVFTGKARPHYLLPGNVFEAAKKRIHWLLDEFDGQVSASVSGGKDSTVVAELLAMCNYERGVTTTRLHFLDQEAEYQATRDYLRTVADRPSIDFSWYQIPFRLFNAANYTDEWLHVWDERLSDEEWIRPKEPDSIQTNDFRTPKGLVIDRFKDVLAAMNAKDGGAILTGMRCEESPTRRVFMTSVPSYKWATWCSAGKWPSASKTARIKADPSIRAQDRSPYFLFHPIYDWSYRDVWKAILDNRWPYNTFYDSQFRYGVSLRNMRVSSFHHELSMQSLDYLQEIEPQTWERATRRLEGLSAYSHIGEEQYHQRGNLPYMFRDWDEYLDYLIEKLIPERNQQAFHKMIERALRVLPHIPHDDVLISISSAVLGNDVYGTSVDQWITTNMPDARRFKERNERLAAIHDQAS